MAYSLFKVLIVDDEPIVREGLRYIIDWTTLGFCICCEAEDGEEALQSISKYQPDLAIIDIRMPKMYGTEFMQKARDQGFSGEFIVLSGYSDFQYAQVALRCGASAYLAKPIDDTQFQAAVMEVHDKLIAQQNQLNSMTQYLKKAKSTVLMDLFTKAEYDSSINYLELGLYAPIYQVVIYEEYTPFYAPYNFADLLRIDNNCNDSFEHITINNKNIILLKGDLALKRFNSCLNHYEKGTEKGSPLDSIFLAYSRTVPQLSDIYYAYEDCKRLLSRRFFCDENQHVLSYEDLPTTSEQNYLLTASLAKNYGMNLTNYIQSYNRRGISQLLTDLKQILFYSNTSVMSIKHFLADIFLQIKDSILRTYENVDIPFSHNAGIIELIENKYYLYEILLYFTEQFEMIIRAIGNNSRESIFDDIMYYVNHNYNAPLKLELIAPLFGYSSAYLGKLFTQKNGKSFNSYLDEIRIQHAIDLLKNTDLKIYEIASKVGYKKIDSFNQKFKKIAHISPSEYRKNILHS